MEEYDYIIVGQGLAGSAVAARMLTMGRRIAVFDVPESNISSSISAGLFNPVTGSKMHETWLAAPLFSYLHTYYTSVEKKLSSKFFYPKPLFRPFFSAGEQNDWQGNDQSPFIKEIKTEPFKTEHIHNPFGGLVLQHCGYLNTSQYILSIRNWISSSGAYFNELFDCQNVSLGADSVVYKTLRAKQLIFCTGVTNPSYFDWVPIRKLKGEVLMIKAEFLDDYIVNRGVYIVPVSTEVWKVGSTYVHPQFEYNITTEGRAELEGKLSQLMASPYEVIGQEFGVRPATPDRRPIMGFHPASDRILFFGGLGTKGISLAPYFADQLVRCIENGSTADNAVNISRYYSLYWKSSDIRV